MTSEVEQSPTSPSKLMHQTIDHLSTILSIAQFYLMDEAVSPELQADMKRIVQTAREVSSNLRHLAEILLEDE